MLSQPSTQSAFLRIISAMITPAILILATGSLVVSTMTRLNRAGDRARALLVEYRAARDVGDERIDDYTGWLLNYRRRSGLTERALTLYYMAIFLFVGSSLAIAVDNLLQDTIPWLSLVLVVIGALFLFSGTAALVVETQLATGQIRHEIEATLGETIEQMQSDLSRRAARAKSKGSARS